MKKIFLSFLIIFMFKILSAQITFQKTFRGYGNSGGYDIKQTTDGGYIIAGQYEIIGVSFKGYLIKTDAYGDTLWTKIFGGIEHERGNSVQQTTDGGYVCLGRTLLKTDANGNLLWAKTYGTGNTYLPECVQQTTDGGYIIAGSTSSFGAGSYDVYLVKTDSNGNWLWSKTFGGTGDDEGYSVQQTTDGGYIIAGYTASFGAGGDDVYLIKTNSSGNLVWSKTFGGTGEDIGYSVQQTTDGGYIITGNTFPFVYLIKTDANGDSLWTKSMGLPTANAASCVQQTTDGGYIITGTTCPCIGPSGTNVVLLVKTDGNGNVLWTNGFGGNNLPAYGSAVKQTADGGYIITGSSVAFGPSMSKVYLIKTDSMGNSCNQSADSGFFPSDTTGTQVLSPATIVTSPSLSVTNPAITDSSGGFVTTVCISTGINEITKDNYFLISPNPSIGKFIISFGETIMNGNVEILNILGENAYTENIFNESKKEINLQNISAGIYFVKAYDGEKYYCKKLIVE